jgi:hypothetical protein
MSAASLSPTRRELLAATAAAGAVSTLPGTLHAAAGRDAIRPAGRGRRATPAHRCHALARARVGIRRSVSANLGDLVGRRHTRRAARDDAETCALLGE